MTKVRFLLLLLIVVAGLVLAAGRLLEVNSPEHADVIVVLAGETQDRPLKGIELLQAGYAPRMVLDVTTQERVFNTALPDLAQHWVDSLPQKQQVSICPIAGLSTRDESHEARNCIRRFNARRAFSIFRHELPGFHFSIAATPNPVSFGLAWWRHREWAKTTFYESIRLLWWEVVDRWRG
jgi:uncharacterized SAM-binding protein YcdF (DUF218 family)